MKLTKKQETKEKQEEREQSAFNQGRLAADDKWKTEIDRRIAELEASVGIPELRRLKQKTMYRWGETDEERNKGVRQTK